jgi:large subunit ribosomal protein L23
MDLSRVIIGPIVTEKSERLKGDNMYTLKVNQRASKVDVKNALRKYWDCQVTNIRVLRVPSKVRTVGRGQSIQKRRPYKKMLVTLAPKSKPLDLAAFKTS